MPLSRPISLAACIFALLSPLLHAQTPPRLTFDVASIRPSKPDPDNMITLRALPGGNGYRAVNCSVGMMFTFLYKIHYPQLSGGPDWLNDSFDIEARTDRPYSLDELHTMFQNLLADRFHIKFHTVVKQGPIYSLTIDKSGLKMKPDPGEDLTQIRILPGPNDTKVGRHISMSYMAWWLGWMFEEDERPVIDNTGLTDKYAFILSYNPNFQADDQSNDSPSDPRPSLFDALRKQLGLNLRPQSGPVTYYVIDSAEKPSEN